MNKTILTAGVTAVVALAVGTAGGYYFAKKRFDDELPDILAQETDALKKHYSILLMEARSGKPASPADIPNQKGVRDGIESTLAPEEEESDEEPEELTEQDKKAMRRGRAHLAQAAAAMTDYRGISTEKMSAGGDSPTTNNIFVEEDKRKGSPKKALPPRDDSGHFRKKTKREEQSTPPEIITEEAFLQNDGDLEQESLLWFVNDKTLVLEAEPTEPQDISLVGEMNLTRFPTGILEGDPCMIFVHNSGLEVLYEVKLMRESLTAYLGLGENSDDDDHDATRYL